MLREAFAALAGQVGEGHDLVVVARPGAAELAERDGLAGVQEALAELLAKAGLTAARGGGLVSSAAAARSQPALPVRLARALVCPPIVVYQRLISPALPRRCKYEPTCSRYAVDAIREFGVARGLVLAAWRLLRCNPFSYGGYDPVEDQRLFKGAHRHDPTDGSA